MITDRLKTVTRWVRDWKCLFRYCVSITFSHPLRASNRCSHYHSWHQFDARVSPNIAHYSCNLWPPSCERTSIMWKDLHHVKGPPSSEGTSIKWRDRHYVKEPPPYFCSKDAIDDVIDDGVNDDCHRCSKCHETHRERIRGSQQKWLFLISKVMNRR